MPGLHQPFRVQPLMRPQDYVTYGWSAPLATHWRRATCEEAECSAFLNGWVTTVDISTELGQRQAHYIEHDTSRSCAREADGSLVRYTFRPGTPCFRRNEHRTAAGRPPVFTVRQGDWRMYGGRAKVHARAEDWCEDFALHQDALATAVQRG